MTFSSAGYDSPLPDVRSAEAAERGVRAATPEARAAARRVASALEGCLSMPDRPELSYLRCFVRMAFEEATALGALGQPSDEDLAYLERLQRETRDYRARVQRSRAARVLAEI
jgi:hypothetical protein